MASPTALEHPEPPDRTGLSIAAVEQETGLSKDLLRIWERRYNFPLPLRNAHGERLYAQQEVAKLKLVRRLLDLGMRPGRILALPIGQLQELARSEPAAQCSAQHDLALYLLKTRQRAELRSELDLALQRDGLLRFVTETAAPLSELVGESWMRGELQIFEEHLFTELLQGVLRGAIATMAGPGGPPRVLLTTLPMEQHGLGLLMAEAVLALEGAECISLGTQTPVGDIVAAAMASKADIVALSFSGNFPANPMSDGLRVLRDALPPSMAVWCGGAGAARMKRLPAGATRVAGLRGIGESLSDWRISLGAPTGPG